MTIHLFIAAYLVEVAIAWPTLPHDAVTATVGALCLPFMGFALAESSHAILRVPAVAGAIMAMLAIYRAESRAVLGGAALAIMGSLALSHRRWQRLGILLISIVLLGFVATTGPLGRKLQLLLQHEPGWDSGRIPLWTQAWDAFRRHPWIGSGPGTPSGPLNSAHNSYLSALSELGLIGCGLYMLIGGLALIQLAFVLRTEVPSWQKRVALALIAAIMAQGTIGWGYSLQNWQLTYAFIGLALAVQRSASSDQLASDGI